MHAVQVRVRTVLWAVVMTALVVGNARAADRFVTRPAATQRMIA